MTERYRRNARVNVNYCH